LKLPKALKRTKNEYEKALEPQVLNSNPMTQEGKLVIVPILPLLIILGGILWYGRNMAETPEDFGMVATLGFTGWLMYLVAIYAWSKSKGAEYKLFDREFGFSKRLHPRCEIYCKPEDIRCLLTPKDRVENPKGLDGEIEKLGFDEKTSEAIKKHIAEKPAEKHFYYFRHKDPFEGFDVADHTIKTFRSHAVFIEKPYDEQFCFASGQENWYGPVMYNHPSAESDNVKVLFWTLDPFTNEPMPVCQLIHSSNDYERKQEQSSLSKEFSEIEAQSRVIAHLFGLNESLRKEVNAIRELKDANLGIHKGIVGLSREGINAYVAYWTLAMKATSRGWLHSTWAKAILTIVTIGAIVFLIAYVLHWIDLSSIFG
jgi:hypothetical protein